MRTQYKGKVRLKAAPAAADLKPPEVLLEIEPRAAVGFPDRKALYRPIWRTQAYSPAIGRRPCLRRVEFLKGLAEQGLDRPALGGTEHAQLAVDSRGKVAGDLDAPWAGTGIGLRRSVGDRRRDRRQRGLGPWTGPIPGRLGNGPFGYPAIPLAAGLLFALDRWMARRPGASPGAADDRLRAVGWFRGWDVERGGVRRPRVLASRMPRA